MADIIKLTDLKITHKMYPIEKIPLILYNFTVEGFFYGKSSVVILPTYN